MVGYLGLGPDCEKESSGLRISQRPECWAKDYDAV